MNEQSLFSLFAWSNWILLSPVAVQGLNIDGDDYLYSFDEGEAIVSVFEARESVWLSSSNWSFYFECIVLRVI